MASNIPNSNAKNKNGRGERGCNQSDDRDFEVAIITDEEEALSTIEANYVVDYITFMLLNNEWLPTPILKSNPVASEGVVKLTLSDQNSCEWIKKLIEEYEPPKGQPKLKVVQQRDILARHTTASVTLHLPTPEMTPRIALQVLKAQNPWAKMDTWPIFKEENQGKCIYLGFRVPFGVMPKIKAHDYRLHYLLQMVGIKFCGIDGQFRYLSSKDTNPDLKSFTISN